MMKNSVKDKRLNYELRELYLIAEDWISNVRFIDDEINFLLYVLHKYADPCKPGDLATIREDFYRILNEQKAISPGLMTEITTCLKTIEPLANDPTMINITMLEGFSNTAQKVLELSAAVNAIKKQLFVFVEQFTKKKKISS